MFCTCSKCALPCGQKSTFDVIARFEISCFTGYYDIGINCLTIWPWCKWNFVHRAPYLDPDFHLIK